MNLEEDQQRAASTCSNVCWTDDCPDYIHHVLIMELAVVLQILPRNHSPIRDAAAATTECFGGGFDRNPANDPFLLLMM
jgi:hypothetical protein